MYDKGKIVFGILVFLVLTTSPWWYRAAAGTGGPRPELEKAALGKDCVLPAAQMRGDHMELLYQWRDEYVREGKLLVSGEGGEPARWPDGKPMMKSLSNTCLRCHVNKGNFCDRCHNYAGVDPYCWDCHVLPKGSK